MKNIVIIGSGNVAEAFATALAGNDKYRLVQIFARNKARGEVISRMSGATTTDDPSQLAEADIYIIAVSDSSINEISRKLNFGEAVVAHTAGSVGIDELSLDIHNRGVIYPLQTFTAGEKVDFHEVPLFIEGSTKTADNELRKLAEELSEHVTETTSQQRLALHISGVFACNFVNSMYAEAQELLRESGIDPRHLNCLIEETAQKAIRSQNAADVQTGPARRGDTGTMKKHIVMLKKQPKLKKLYKLLSSNIWETSKKTSQK